MARRLPKPHVRPSVTMSSTDNRSWQHIQAKDVRVGDIVANRGLVTSGQHFESTATIPPVRRVTLEFLSTDTQHFEFDADLFVFTKGV